jgi:hypothetical protein
VLVPPVLLKIGSTGYRFGRYYLGSSAYGRKGPPPPVLRLLGPVVVASTLGVLDSGTALMFVGTGLRQGVLLLQGQFLGVARRCGVLRSRSPVGPSTPGPA